MAPNSATTGGAGWTPTLNCPAEVGYETTVTVLKVNEAVEANRRLAFSQDSAPTRWFAGAAQS